MSLERKMLTHQLVREAEQGKLNHPIVDVIDRNLATIIELSVDYFKIANPTEGQHYIKANYGFLADALVESDSFSLDPLDIVTIWSRVMEAFPESLYYRYTFATMISSVYAIQGINNEEWKHFPRYFIEKSRLPAEILRDRNGLIHVQQGLKEVTESIEEIDSYRGHNPHPLLYEIRENFGNGAGILIMHVKKELNGLQSK